jgi:PAS domain S-box-containing protein
MKDQSNLEAVKQRGGPFGKQDQTADLLHLFVDAVIDYAIILLDAKGHVLTWSRAAERIKGWTADEIIGQHFSSFYPLEDVEAGKAELELKVAAEEGRFEYEGWRVRKDGSRFWANVIMTSLYDEHRKLRGFGKVTRDLTARLHTEQLLQAAKQEAEAANHAKSEFLSRMSHELRTPLNSVLGFAQLLQMAQLSGRSVKYVEHILKAGRHLLVLIDEVLDMARIEAGKLALSLEPVHLSESVEAALDMLLPMAAASGIQICNEIGPDSQQYVTADRQRLQQVLLNLLSNAIKYNRRNGRVVVSFESLASGRIRVKIADTGAGIAPGQLDRLFLPFERIDSGPDYVQGTGLGLALSKKLIEAMGGYIGVESQPGKGSTFWIDLPSAERPTQRIERKGSLATAVPQCLSAASILYIEDNIENVRLMEHVLSYRPQIHLLVAMQGRLALDLAAQHTPDLIFLDLHLPDVGGDFVLQQLRAHPSTNNIPIIIVSADATPGQIRRLKDAGATDYLTKPLDVVKLLRMLDDHLKTKVRSGPYRTT